MILWTIFEEDDKFKLTCNKMNLFRKSSLLSILLLLCVWVSPIVAHTRAIYWSCRNTECCCACKTNNVLNADSDHVKTSHCKCSVSNNDSLNNSFFLSTKNVDNRVLHLLSDTLEEQIFSEKKTLIEFKYTNNHPIILSLFLLKSSFLL